MKFIINILLTALLVFGISELLPGVQTDDYWTAIVVAIVLGILNFCVRPLLVILTLPVTVLTLGLFLLIVNALIILLADWFVGGFDVENIWWAVLFSVLISIGQSIFDRILEKKEAA